MCEGPSCSKKKQFFGNNYQTTVTLNMREVLQMNSPLISDESVRRLEVTSKEHEEAFDVWLTQREELCKMFGLSSEVSIVVLDEGATELDPPIQTYYRNEPQIETDDRGCSGEPIILDEPDRGLVRLLDDETGGRSQLTTVFTFGFCEGTYAVVSLRGVSGDETGGDVSLQRWGPYVKYVYLRPSADLAILKAKLAKTFEEEAKTRENEREAEESDRRWRLGQVFGQDHDFGSRESTVQANRLDLVGITFENAKCTKVDVGDFGSMVIEDVDLSATLAEPPDKYDDEYDGL